MAWFVEVPIRGRDLESLANLFTNSSIMSCTSFNVYARTPAVYVLQGELLTDSIKHFVPTYLLPSCHLTFCFDHSMHCNVLVLSEMLWTCLWSYHSVILVIDQCLHIENFAGRSTWCWPIFSLGAASVNIGHSLTVLTLKVFHATLLFSAVCIFCVRREGAGGRGETFPPKNSNFSPKH